MKRLRPLMVWSVVALLGFALWQSPPWSAEQDWSAVEIKVERVAGTVYMLEGAGGNIAASVGTDGVLLVDTQFQPLADKIRAAVKGIGGERLRFVINSHWHADHTGGNPVFGLDATIISHVNVRNRLLDDQTVFDRVVPAIAPEGLPVVTFEAALSLHFNGEEVRAIHYPHGHTDGDCVVFFSASNVVHLGDHFFAGRFPFVDLGTGGSVEGLAKNVKEILGGLPPDAKLIPGHGPLSRVDDLKQFHRMLVETRGLVRDRLGKGEGLDEIKAAGLPKEWEAWGQGFIKTDQWIETVYKSLMKGGVAPQDAD